MHKVTMVDDTISDLVVSHSESSESSNCSSHSRIFTSIDKQMTAIQYTVILDKKEYDKCIMTNKLMVTSGGIVSRIELTDFPPNGIYRLFIEGQNVATSKLSKSCDSQSFCQCFDFTEKKSETLKTIIGLSIGQDTREPKIDNRYDYLNLYRCNCVEILTSKKLKLPKTNYSIKLYGYFFNNDLCKYEYGQQIFIIYPNSTFNLNSIICDPTIYNLMYIDTIIVVPPTDCSILIRLDGSLYKTANLKKNINNMICCENYKYDNRTVKFRELDNKLLSSLHNIEFIFTNSSDVYFNRMIINGYFVCRQGFENIKTSAEYKYDNNKNDEKVAQQNKLEEELVNKIINKINILDPKKLLEINNPFIFINGCRESGKTNLVQYLLKLYKLVDIIVYTIRDKSKYTQDKNNNITLLDLPDDTTLWTLLTDKFKQYQKGINNKICIVFDDVQLGKCTLIQNKMFVLLCKCLNITIIIASQLNESTNINLLYDIGFMLHRSFGYESFTRYEIFKDTPFYELFDDIHSDIKTDFMTSVFNKITENYGCFTKIKQNYKNTKPELFKMDGKASYN